MELAKKILFAPLLVLIASFYFFPFESDYLPEGMNTKMFMAAIGLVWAIYNTTRQHDSMMNKGFITLSLWAALVSLFGIVAVTVNETPDYTYATYIVSMWVWLGGAYVVIQLIKALHGYVDVILVCNYLIAVCVFQCILAFWMDQSIPLKHFIDSIVASEGYMGKVSGRIYGMGASLDVSGMRFAAVLIMISVLLMQLNIKEHMIVAILYVLSFFIITVYGNMMGRTTIVGVAIGLAYIVIFSLWNKNKEEHEENIATIWKIISIILVIGIPILVHLYHTNIGIHNNLRFAFEGFFSLWEKGYWETNSNNRLATMVVFPDNMMTWLIGDGYFDSPADSDPYYVGTSTSGYYMGTDIGYLRFIFYFGLPGLLSFVIFMFKAAQITWERFPQFKSLLMLILLLNYIVWFKVSSDLFSVFALFLCIPASCINDGEISESQKYNLKQSWI